MVCFDSSEIMGEFDSDRIPGVSPQESRKPELFRNILDPMSFKFTKIVSILTKSGGHYG